MALIDKVRMACRLTTNTYDSQLDSLIKAALKDMEITDISNLDETDPLIEEAVMTYCRMKFGYATLPADQYDRLQAAYNDRKSALIMSSGYTDWGRSDA